MRPFFLRAALAALLLPFSLTGYADNSSPPLGACYMGYGKMLEAAQSRQLSLNANVSQFLYQPGGLEIAYAGYQQEGEGTTEYIRLVGLKQGTVKTLLLTPVHRGNDDDTYDPTSEPYSLAGWSGDGRYLFLYRQPYVKVDDTGDGYFSADVLCADVGADPIHLSPVPLPTVSVASGVFPNGFTQCWWSPDRNQMLFTLQGRRKQGGTSSLINVISEIYDPKTDRLEKIAVPDGQIVRGWLDTDHLLLDDSSLETEFKPSSKVNYLSEDIGTGTAAAIPTPLKMPHHYSIGAEQQNGVSPKAAYLRLEDEPHKIQDAQKISTVDAHALWVRRTQGPKLSSAVPVGLTPGPDDPQAVWSPTGNQIAFISHDDLFVTNLTIRDATLEEKYAAGEQLTCEEERDVAASHLKQIGLGIIQYAQDFDENFPPGDDWKEKIGPYLKDDSLFSIGGHPVVYHAPADLGLAKMDSPATTVLATTDLPCATLVLFADGHVKAFKDEAAVKQWTESEANPSPTQ